MGFSVKLASEGKMSVGGASHHQGIAVPAMASVTSPFIGTRSRLAPSCRHCSDENSANFHLPR